MKSTSISTGKQAGTARTSAACAAVAASQGDPATNMDAALRIDYQGGLATFGDASYEELVRAVTDEMPHAWLARYERMCTGPTNVLVIEDHGFSYLFDYCSELAANGLSSAPREDRLVAAFGHSQQASDARPASRIAGFPGSDDRGDRGHFIAHASGGGVDINLFHQERSLNRGWSPQGRRYREMERYLARHHGLFCFSRPVYADETARPTQLELGILRPERTFWVRLFDNPPITT